MGKASRAKRAAKKEQQAGPQPNRRTQVLVFGAVGLLAVGIVGSAVAFRPQPEPPIAAVADPAAVSPDGVLPADSDVAYGFVNGTFDPAKPTLAIWEDFQCPACKMFEDRVGVDLQRIAADGLANVVYRPTTFLDVNLGSDASTRATAAWGCAIDAGKGMEYHDVIYANQPQIEGTGYTAADLTGFADEAGISDAARAQFDACVADRTYVGWAANSTQKFYEANVPGTPYVTLNGVPLSNEIISDGLLLRAEVERVAAGGAPQPGEETPGTPTTP